MAIGLTGPIRYQCCFCGLTIEKEVPDLGSLVYTTCTDRASGMQQSQQFFCHVKCLRTRLHSAAKLYSVDLLNKHLSGEIEREEGDSLP